MAPNRPIARSISASNTVAKLSVMMTESVRNPICRPSMDARETTTRLGCPDRPRLLEIMARMIWGKPVCRLLACTTNAGRRFAVRRLESGYRTSTTSPRLYGIVDIHFRTIPVFSECLQSLAQVGCLSLVNSSFGQTHLFGADERDDDLSFNPSGQWLEQLNSTVSKDAFK